MGLASTKSAGGEMRPKVGAEDLKSAPAVDELPLSLSSSLMFNTPPFLATIKCCGNTADDLMAAAVAGGMGGCWR